MFSSDLAQKIQEAEKHATQHRDQKLSIKEREIIMGGLSHLLAVPEYRNEIMTRVKRIESEHTAQVMKHKGYIESIRFVLRVFMPFMGICFLRPKMLTIQLSSVISHIISFCFVLICTGYLLIWSIQHLGGHSLRHLQVLPFLMYKRMCLDGLGYLSRTSPISFPFLLVTQ
jgi:hypothetical protein